MFARSLTTGRITKATALLALLFSICGLLPAHDYIITTDEDFLEGSFVNIDVAGTGESSSLQLGQQTGWWTPASSPPWMNKSYRYRRQICVSNESISASIPDYFTVTARLPLGDIVPGKAMDSLKDVIIARYDSSLEQWSELPRWIEPGTSVEFDGANDHIVVADSASTSVTGDMTIEAWIYPTATSGYNGIINKDTGIAPNRGYMVSLNNGYIFFIVSLDGSDTNTSFIASSTPVTSNAWTHVATTFDASTGELAVFINGSKDGAYQVGNVSGIFDNTQSLRIGSNNASGTASGFFNGRIDEVRISSSVRYTANFTTDRKVFLPDSDTAALWHFDDPFTLTAEDMSGNGNYAVLTNNPVYAQSAIKAKAYPGNEVSFMMPMLSAVTAKKNSPNFYVYYGNDGAVNPIDNLDYVMADYADGFEYTDDITTRGWEVTAGDGTAATVTTKQKQGDSSVMTDSTSGANEIEIRKAMEIPVNFHVIAWFHDDASDLTKTEWISPGTLSTQGYGMGVVTSSSPSYYCVSDGAGGWTVTTAGRTTGWHKFELRRYNSVCEFWIDGKMVDTKTLDNELLSYIYIHSGGAAAEAGTGYWDEIFCSMFLPVHYVSAEVGSEIDLVNYPTWGFRRPITITNNSTNPIPKSYTLRLPLDHDALVTASKSNVDGSDVRILYYDSNASEYIELHREAVNSWGATDTEIAFRSKSTIGGLSSDDNYFIFYDCTNASAPPDDKSLIYLFSDDFEDDTASNAPRGWVDISQTGAYAKIEETVQISGTKSLRLQGLSTGATAGVSIPLIETDPVQLDFWAQMTDVDQTLECGFLDASSLLTNAALTTAMRNTFFTYRSGLTYTSTVETPTADTWYKFTIIKDSTGEYTSEVRLDDGSLVYSATDIVSVDEANYIALFNYPGSTVDFFSYIDDVVLTKYFPLLPEFTLGSVEEQGYVGNGTFFSKVVDGGATGTLAKDLDWASNGTLLIMEMKADDYIASLLSDPYTGWTYIASPGDISDLGLVGRYFQIRARFTGDGNSPEPILYSVDLFYNRPPLAPTNMTPADDIVISTTTPTLYAGAFDDQNDSDTHSATKWQVRPASGSYGSSGWESDNNTTDLTTIAVPSGYLANWGVYFWRVAYYDQHGDLGDYSEETTFTVILGYDASGTDTIAPAVPYIYAPENGFEFIDTDSPILDWSNVSDPSGTSYQVEVYSNSSLSGTPLMQEVVTDSTDVASSLANGTYYWRVRAIDGAGNAGEWSVTYSFIVNLTAPASDDGTDDPPVDDGGTPSPKSGGGGGCFLKGLFS